MGFIGEGGVVAAGLIIRKGFLGGGSRMGRRGLVKERIQREKCKKGDDLWLTGVWAGFKVYSYRICM